MNPCFDEDSLIYSVGQYEFRKLIAKEEIRCAENILYEAYITEQNWGIQPGNQSGLKIRTCQSHNFHYLTDSHSHAAHWFGAFYSEKIVGCFRVLNHSENELEKYIKLPSWLKRSSPCELNRLAIRKKHREKKAVTLMLMRISFDFAFYLNSTCFVTAEYPRLSKLYAKLGLVETGLRFKYNNHEKHAVELLYYDTKLFDRFKTPLYRLTDMYISIPEQNIINKTIQRTANCAPR